MATAHQLGTLILAASQVLLQIVAGSDPLLALDKELGEATVAPDSNWDSETMAEIQTVVHLKC